MPYPHKYINHFYVCNGVQVLDGYLKYIIYNIRCIPLIHERTICIKKSSHSGYCSLTNRWQRYNSIHFYTCYKWPFLICELDLLWPKSTPCKYATYQSRCDLCSTVNRVDTSIQWTEKVLKGIIAKLHWTTKM